MEAKEGIEQKHPYLTRAIEKAPTFVKDGYLVNAFSFGEYGITVEPELIDEIVGGLEEKMRPSVDGVDYLIPLAPGGARWGLVVAHGLGLDVKPIHLKRGGPLYEVDLEDELKIEIAGFHSRELRIRDVNQGDRAIILDDVISTGESIKAVVETLTQQGVEIKGIFAIVTKGDDYKKVQEELGIPIQALVNLAKEGKITQVDK